MQQGSTRSVQSRLQCKQNCRNLGPGFHLASQDALTSRCNRQVLPVPLRTLSLSKCSNRTALSADPALALIPRHSVRTGFGTATFLPWPHSQLQIRIFQKVPAPGYCCHKMCVGSSLIRTTVNKRTRLRATLRNKCKCERQWRPKPNDYTRWKQGISVTVSKTEANCRWTRRTSGDIGSPSMRSLCC